MSVHHATSFVKRALVSTSALLMLAQMPANAAQAPVEVSFEVEDRRDCRDRTVRPRAERGAVKEVAEARFGLNEDAAARLAENVQGLISGSSQPLDKPQFRNGVCTARYMVTTNDLAIQQRISATAHCDRPVGIIARVNYEKRPEEAKRLARESQANLLNAFRKREFALVDISEQNEVFRELLRSAGTCAYTGGPLECPEREHTLDESIFEILSNTDLIMDYWDDDNIRGEKYLTLQNDGVLAFVELNVRELRSAVQVVPNISAYQVEDRNAAWTFNANPVSVSTHNTETLRAVGTAILNVAEFISVEAAKQCHAS